MKKSLILFMVILLGVSNVPLHFFADEIFEFVSERNIVDPFWKASLDDNVVDSFPSLRGLAKQLKTREALAAANGDGKIFYSISANTTPRTRDYISSTNSFNTAVSTVVGATALQSVLKASPTRDEMVAGYVNSAGTLQVMCWNGTSWSNEWSVAVGGTGTTRRFDIAYEKNSGDAIILYSTNAGTTNELAYRTKLGSTACGSANWSGATNLDPVRTTGVVQWVKLATDRRAAQNLVTAIWADAVSDLSAMVWSGSAWGNEPGAALETALEIATAAQDVESFDVEYESTSGDVMVVWGSGGTNGTNGAYYAVCTGGTSTCTWGAKTAMPTLLDDATHIDIAGDPNGDSILFASIGNAGSDMQHGVWSGSAWTNTANVDTATAAPIAGTKFVAVGWLNNGATKRGVLIYYDSGSANIGWYTVNGTTWTAQTDWVTTPIFGTQKNYDIDVDPFNLDRLIVSVNDANSDIFAKRLIMDAAGAFTWTNADGSVAIEANTGSATYKTFDFEYNRFIPAVPTVTIGKTAGAKIATRNSGDTGQYAHDTACTGAASCAAFTLLLNTGSATLTSFKVTETGTVSANADLSNAKLYYDTDGNWSDAGAETQYGSTVASFTSEAATFSGSLALSAGTTYYFYVGFDVKSGTPTYPVGGQGIDFQIAANGDVVVSGGASVTGAPQTLTSAGSTCATTAQICVKPQITGYTNSTEAGLNYAASCTGCGARIGPGSGSRQTVIISGYGFGSDPGLGSRDTATNKAEIAGAATTMLADDGSANTNVSAWSNTSITIRTDTNITGNTDTDFGTNFGDSAALRVTAGGQAVATDKEFYIFPQVTSITHCAELPAGDTAREYDAGDAACTNGLTDGQIELNGTRFGSGSTGGFVRILGCDATTCSSPSGSVTIDSWANTVIRARVPTVIADNVYTGTVSMQQGTGSNNKTGSYAGTFRVLPRITSNNPLSDIIGSVIQVNGNHLCQSGTCPVSPNRSTASDNVQFGSTQAADGDFVNQTGGAGACDGAGVAWDHDEICVRVPAGTPTGSQPTKVTSTSGSTHTSNTSPFTRVSTVPSDPTGLLQYKSDGTTSISIGGGTNETSVVLEGDLSATLSITMALNVEVKPVGTAFNGVVTATSTTCTGTSCPNKQVTVSGLVNGTQYHWRARTINTGTYEASNWVAFGGNPAGDGSTDGSPANTDFYVDTAGPTISNLKATDPTLGAGVCTTGSPSDIQAKICWNTDETANRWIAYGTSCPTGQSTASTTFDTLPNKKPLSATGSGTSHEDVLSGLTAATTYHYMVRSVDSFGNKTFDPSSANTCNTFTTASAVTRLIKTSEFFIQQSTTTPFALANAYPINFDIFIPESNSIRSNIVFRSIIIEVSGITVGDGGISDDINVSVNLNGAGATTYVLSDDATTAGKALHWSLSHPASTINFDCPGCSNTSDTLDISITGTTNESSGISAKAIITYQYTP